MKNSCLVLLAFLTVSDVTAQKIDWVRIPWVAPSYGSSPYSVVSDSTIYAVGYRDYMAMPETTPLYKTTNGGRSWTTTTPWGLVTTLPNDGAFYGTWASDIFFEDSLNGWASTNKGLLKTTDAGATWVQSLEFDPFSSFRVHFLKSTEDMIAFKYALKGSPPRTRSVHLINRISDQIQSGASTQDLQLVGIEDVSSAVALRDTLYVAGPGPMSGTYVAWRPLADSNWTVATLDSNLKMGVILRVRRGELLAAFGNNILKLDPTKASFNAITVVAAEIKDFEIIASGEAIVSLKTAPYLVVSDSELLYWKIAGKPFWLPGYLSVFKNSIYHQSGGTVHRGNVSAGGELALFLEPSRHSRLLRPLGSYDTIDCQLWNYGDSTATSVLRVESKQVVNVTTTTIELSPRSHVGFRTIIRSITPEPDTARIYAVVGAESHLIGMWVLNVPAPILETQDVAVPVRVLSFDKVRFRGQLLNRGLDTLRISSIRSEDGLLEAEHPVAIASGKYASIYLVPSALPGDKGRLIVESNSPYSPDTLIYAVDSSSQSPTLRAVDKTFGGPGGSAIQGITAINSTVYSASHTSVGSGNRVVDIIRHDRGTSPATVHTVDIDTGDLESALSIGTSSSDLLTMIRSETLSGGGISLRLDTNGFVSRTDTIRANIRSSRQRGEHLHLRLDHPEYWYSPGHPDYRVRVGERAEVRSNIRSAELAGRSSYDGWTIADHGDASATASSVDSMGCVFIAGLEETGTGSYSMRNVKYDSVVRTTNGYMQTFGMLPSQMETTPNGKLALRSGSKLVVVSASGYKLFERYPNYGIYTGMQEDFYLRSVATGLELQRVDSTGKPIGQFSLQTPSFVNSTILDAQILSNGHVYLLTDDQDDISVIHFDSSGTLLQSVYLDGGYFRRDAGVQFIRMDSQIVVAMNTTGPSGTSESLLYWINWRHPAGPAKSKVSGAPERSVVHLHPNPAKDFIQYTTGVSILNVLVHDALGRTHPVDWSDTVADISHLPAGVYYLTFETTGGRTTASFVLTR